MPTIDHGTVERLAHLARLDLAPEELAQYAGQLEQILAYVQQLSEVDTTDIDPLAHPLTITDVLREDQPQTGLSNDAALANAPARHEGFFKVPTVLEQGGGA